MSTHSQPAPTATQDKRDARDWYSRNRELAWSLIAGGLLGIGWIGETFLSLSRPFSISIYFVSYGFGSYALLKHEISTIRKGRYTFDIDLLMLAAAIGAATLGAFSEGAFLLFLFSLAHALENYALGRARGAIRALAELAPAVGRVLRDGLESEVPTGQIAVGDIVVVRPAERIPVDGKVRSGRSAVNQAPITGESVPVDKEPGQEVFAGTVNGEGALEVETTRSAGDRTLDRVIKLVEEAQTQKAPTQQFTEKFERYFVPLVLMAAVLLIVVPPLLAIWSWQLSFYRAMAFLVAASPCALALGTPAAVLTAIAQAARHGVLIKGGAHLETLGALRAIAFDKTGTLTIGKPEVTDIIPLEATDVELMRVAGSVEQRSQHPLARAVVIKANVMKLNLSVSSDLESVTARGVRSSVDGEKVEIGSLNLWEIVPEKVKCAVVSLQQNGRSIMVVKKGDKWLGIIGIADRPRKGVKEVLNRLRDAGMRSLVMLTGDNSGVGNAVGKEVGIDLVKANLMPEDKVAAIQEMISAHTNVAMIGDGVNDAPALAAATVGIAMGGAGTAVALETADVALMGDDLSKLIYAVSLSRQARSVIRQNLVISLSVMLFLSIATVAGFSGIGVAVIIHEGSTLVVLVNALRLLLFKEHS